MYPHPMLRGDLVATPTALRLIRADGTLFALDQHRYLIDVLRLIDGEHDWDDILLALPPTISATDFIGWLTKNNLLLSCVRQPFDCLRIRLYGSGALGQMLTSQILAEGPESLTIVARDGKPYGCEAPASQVFGTHDTSTADGPEMRIDRQWICGDDQPDIAVVAGPGIQPDRAILEDLRIRRIPTLLVFAHHDFARIGPLFISGTSCWRCADAQIRVADPAWPECVSILSGATPRPTQAAARWASTWAIIQLLLWRSTENRDLHTSALSWDAAGSEQFRTNLVPCQDCLSP